MSARELSRVEVLSRVKAGTLSVKSAATLLAVGYRQAKRLARRYRAEGAKGLKHRGAGGASNHACPTVERERGLALAREKHSARVDAGAAVSGGRGEGPEASERGWRGEPCVADGRERASVGARAGEVDGTDRVE